MAWRRVPRRFLSRVWVLRLRLGPGLGLGFRLWLWLGLGMGLVESLLGVASILVVYAHPVAGRLLHRSQLHRSLRVLTLIQTGLPHFSLALREAGLSIQE